RGLADEAWAGIPEALAVELGELAEAGATWAIVVPAGPADRLELIGREVVPRVRALARPPG
ncbi:MAG TPA: hypothetical protein VEA19_07425, partial [Actinomycetota bacterium]|nr:hypothetical protein [Actinomycetota bacterium]